MEIKNKQKLIIRSLLGITLLVILFTLIGGRSTLSVLANFNFRYLALIMFISFFMISISCLKWKIFLADRGIHVSIWKLISLYVVGYFFNLFLPGSISGDVLRTYVLGKSINSHAESFSSIFMERFTGLTALVLIGSLASLFNYKLLLSEPIILVLVSCIFLGLIIFIILLFNKTLIVWFDSKINFPFLHKLKKILLEAYAIIYSYRTKKVILLKTMTISICFHLMTSVNAWVVCKSLGLSINFLDILVFIPIILLASSIPISIGGLGIWEAGFTLLFVKSGLTQAESFSVSLILRAKNYIVALIGGALFTFIIKKQLNPGETNNEKATN